MKSEKMRNVHKANTPNNSGDPVIALVELSKTILNLLLIVIVFVFVFDFVILTDIGPLRVSTVVDFIAITLALHIIIPYSYSSLQVFESIQATIEKKSDSQLRTIFLTIHCQDFGVKGKSLEKAIANNLSKLWEWWKW